MQWVLTSLLLPPLSLALLTLLAGLLAWRAQGRAEARAHRRAGRLAALLALAAALGQLALATPAVSQALIGALERGAPPGRLLPAGAAIEPGAIIILGGDGEATADGLEPGPLTLQRLRAGAALHRRTGLPLLVTGGTVTPDTPPLATAMARSLEADFAVGVRWIEPRAADTHENAIFSIALLREAGIGGAWLVTQGWHMPRAQEAFARLGYPTRAWPASPQGPDGPWRPGDWAPNPVHLVQSWLALREWAGRIVYALRD